MPKEVIGAYALILIIIMVLFCIIMMVSIRLHSRSIDGIINKFKKRILKVTNKYLEANKIILEDAINTFSVGGIIEKTSDLKKMITTDKYELNIGIIPGYGHNNESDGGSVEYLQDSFYKNLQDICDFVYKDMGVYVSFTVIPIKTVYNTEWGCPIGGEDSFLISAIRNPKFCKDEGKWVDACLMVSDSLQNFYNQSTITGNFSKVLMYYNNGTDEPFKNEKETSKEETKTYVDGHKSDYHIIDEELDVSGIKE